MKRISILATAVLMVGACTAEARILGYSYGYGYGANRCRVRWSFHAHGLISGDLYYSPYAFGNGHSGLVPGDVRYSPYAFGHGRSGLVVDSGANYYCGSRAPHYDVRHYSTTPSYDTPEPCDSHEHVNIVRSPKVCGQTAEARKARRAELAQARQEKYAARLDDGKNIIAGYLKGRNIDFRTTRILSIRGKTISVDFLLNDGKTILKYWNPVEILSLGQPQDRRRKFYDKYVESWSKSCAEHLKAGGKIHQIISSDADQILARLPLCPDLNGAEEVYATATEPRP